MMKATRWSFLTRTPLAGSRVAGMYVCMCVCICVCIYVYVYVYMYIHACIDT